MFGDSSQPQAQVTWRPSPRRRTLGVEPASIVAGDELFCLLISRGDLATVYSTLPLYKVPDSARYFRLGCDYLKRRNG